MADHDPRRRRPGCDGAAGAPEAFASRTVERRPLSRPPPHLALLAGLLALGALAVWSIERAPVQAYGAIEVQHLGL